MKRYARLKEEEKKIRAQLAKAQRNLARASKNEKSAHEARLKAEKLGKESEANINNARKVLKTPLPVKKVIKPHEHSIKAPTQAEKDLAAKVAHALANHQSTFTWKEEVKEDRDALGRPIPKHMHGKKGQHIAQTVIPAGDTIVHHYHLHLKEDKHRLHQKH